MVGLLFQAITNKQMVCFMYKGMRRYVTPIQVEATSQGARLLGREYGSVSERVYFVNQMIAPTIVEDPNIPEARRYTPWVFGDEGEEQLSDEEKLRKSASKG